MKKFFFVICLYLTILDSTFSLNKFNSDIDVSIELKYPIFTGKNLNMDILLIKTLLIETTTNFIKNLKLSFLKIVNQISEVKNKHFLIYQIFHH